MAAATLEGNPVDVDFGPGSGPGVGEGGGGVDVSSAMIYIHKMAVGLSRNLAPRCSFFRFRFRPNAISCAPNHKSMTKGSPHPFERAFTLIELLVVMALIAILAALATRAFKDILDRTKATKDMSNLRQIGMAMQTLLNDNDQVLPVTAIWPGISTSTTPVLYKKYIATRKVFQSPFDKRTPAESDTAPVSYSINTNMYLKLGLNPNMLKVVSPSSTFLMAPTYNGDPKNTSSWTGNTTSAPDLSVGGVGETTGTHNNGRQINVLFCDWHTESVTFGPSGTAGTFQNTATHWDPTQ